MRKKVIMSPLVRLSEADRTFDLEFWRRIGPEGRLSAAWQMVEELNRIRGKHGRQPRLQRSVQNIQRV